MQIKFLLPAQYELDEAIEYYNMQAPQLGQAMLQEVLAALARICSYPDAWHPISHHARRCQLKRFPYGVIYTQLDEFVLVLAIAHLHRKPAYWKKIISRISTL